MANMVKMQKKLKKLLDDDRYRHTIGVTYTAAALAMRYDVDLDKAQLAGLLHDCAKCIPNAEKLKLCEKYGIDITPIEANAPSLLHAKLGAYLADKEYGVDDPDVQSAITWHTTGRADMTMLEKIVFLADYIEPGRFKATNLNQIRHFAFIDIDMAVYMTMRDTLSYLKESGATIDETTENAFAFYRDLIDSRVREER